MRQTPNDTSPSATVCNSFIKPDHLASAAQARVLIAITFHFVKDRLVYLEQVLQSLAAFPLPRRDIVVFTNTTDSAEKASIRELFRKAGLADGCEARLAVEAGLPHPHNLAWAHKKLISGPFLAPDSPFSHFVYLEDDLRLTFENFAYFLAAREILRPFGNLVPAFLRTEWSAKRQCWVNNDNTAPNLLTGRPFIADDDYAFVGLDNPYWAGFILDQDLAREYIKSRSFDFARSRKAAVEVDSGVRERAAMGMTFENPPAPFLYRVVVPVSVSTRLAPQCVWLPHLPSNYADDPKCPLGKIAMTDLFIGNFNPQNEVALSSFNTRRQKLLRRLCHLGRQFRAACIWCKRDTFVRLGRIRRAIFGPRTPGDRRTATT